MELIVYALRVVDVSGYGENGYCSYMIWLMSDLYYLTKCLVWVM